MKEENTQRKYFIIGAIVVLVVGILLFFLSCDRNRYTIRFEVDGKVLSSSNLKKGETVEIPKEPTKDGYTFAGWYVNGEKFDFNQPINENAEIEARWEVNTYTVRFISGIGDATEEKVEYQSTLTENKPTKKGYEFLGWYLGEELYDFSTPVTSDMTLVAKWKTVEENETIYLVEHYLMNRDQTYENVPFEVQVFRGKPNSTVTPKTLNYKGYKSPKSISTRVKEDGSTVIQYYYEIETFTLNVLGDKGFEEVYGSGNYYYDDLVSIRYVLKPGYHFVNASETLDDLIYTMQNKNTTIHLSSAPDENTSYLVEHYQMDVYGNYPNEPTEVEELTGTTDSFVTPKVKNYIGFTSPRVETIKISGDGSTVLKYYYSRNKYTVKANLGKGIQEVAGTGEYYYRSTVTLKAIVKEGYTFDSWNIGDKEETLEFVLNAENITYNPSATTIHYNIFYDLDGGVNSISNPNTYTVEDSVKLSSPTKLGYTFVRWEENGNEITKIGKGSLGEKTLKAIFTPNSDTSFKTHVYFMDVHGKYNDFIKEINEKGITDSKANPTIISYPGFTVDKVEDKTILADGTTIVNVYYKRNRYALEFIKGEGISDIIVNSTSEDGLFYYEEEVELEAIVEDGYTFKKWSNGEEKTTTKIKMEIGGSSITAVSSPNEYTIKFYSLRTSETAYASVTAKYKEEITLPQAPTRKGYNFVGWYYIDEQKEFTEPFTSETMVLNGATLYAKWELKDESIVFHLTEDEEEPYDYVEGKFGESINYPTEPTKTGYKFLGWYEKNSDTPFEEKIFPDKKDGIELYAKFDIIHYHITYNLNDSINNPKNPNTYTVEEEIILENPTKEGYTFTGWTPSNKIEKGSTEDKEFTAHFIENTLTVNYHNIKNNSHTDGAMESSIFHYTDDVAQLSQNVFESYYEIEYIMNNNEANKKLKYNLEFLGWSDVDNGMVKYTNEQIINDFKNLIKEESKTFNLYAIYKSSVEAPIEAAPVKEGYRFDGWMLNNEIKENTITLTSDIQLEAKWNPYKLTVHYHNTGTHQVGEMSLDTFYYSDIEAKLKSNQLNSNYTVTYQYNNGKESETLNYNLKFLGWATESNGLKVYEDVQNILDKVKELTKTNDDEIDLYAVYDKSVNVPIKNEKIEKDGYEFTGWNLEDTVIKDHYDLDKDIILSATYRPYQLTVNYINVDSQGKGEMAPSVFHYSDDVANLRSNNYQKYFTITYHYDNNEVDKDSEHYLKFLGWSTEQNGSKVYEDTQNILEKVKELTKTSDAAINLYAIYDKSVDVSIEKTLPIKIGYTFAGWKYQDESVNDKYTLTENITLNATWNENTLTVNYHNSKNGNTEGEMDSSVFKYSDSSAILLDNQYNKYYQITYDYQNDTKKYYLTFKGWATIDDGEKTYDNLYDIKDLVKEKTASNNFVLDLYAIYDDSTDVEIEDPTREGYEFKGWYKDSEKVENTYKLNSDITLKATWRPYRLTINYDGNGAINSVSMNHSEFTYESDRTFLETNQFIKEFKLTYDYNDGKNGSKEEKVPVEFLGWSENNGSTEATYKDSNITIEDIKSKIKNSDAEITLYAIWATSAETKITNEIPIKEGYKFYRWLNGENIVTNTVLLTQDTILKADYLQYGDLDDIIQSQITNSEDYETIFDQSQNKLTIKLKHANKNLQSAVNDSIMTNMKSLFTNKKVDSVVAINNENYIIDTAGEKLNELFESLSNTAKTYDTSTENLLITTTDFSKRQMSSLYPKSFKVEITKYPIIAEYTITFDRYEINPSEANSMYKYNIVTKDEYDALISKSRSKLIQYYSLSQAENNIITLYYKYPNKLVADIGRYLSCKLFGGVCPIGGLPSSGMKTLLWATLGNTIGKENEKYSITFIKTLNFQFSGIDQPVSLDYKSIQGMNWQSKGLELAEKFSKSSGVEATSMYNRDLKDNWAYISVTAGSTDHEDYEMAFEDSIPTTYKIVIKEDPNPILDE